MKKLLLFVILVIAHLMPAYSRHNNEPISDPPLSDYQRNVISYFKEIALGFEFGNASQITRKWTTNMKVFVEGTPNPVHINELNVVIAELNELITDNFEIEIVEDRAVANFFIFFGSGAQYAARYPADASLTHSNSGAYHIFWNRSNQLCKGRIFVNTTKTSEEEQRHVIREELTQSLGLGRDSRTYPESVFQLEWTVPTKFADIDKDIIRLLYHPKMVCGLSAAEVESVLMDILLSGNGA